MNNEIISNIKIAEILAKIPHRYPLILVDRIVEIEPGKKITAIKNVTTNEPCFQGHFPENPIMPGVLILESLAQTCALLFIYSLDSNSFSEYTPPKQGIFLFAGIDNVRFKKVVLPGDQLTLECEFIKCKKDLAKFSAQAKVNDQVVCTADLLSAYRDVRSLS